MKLTKGRISQLMKKNKQTRRRYKKHPSKRRTVEKTFRRKRPVNLANMSLKRLLKQFGGDDPRVVVGAPGTTIPQDQNVNPDQSTVQDTKTPDQTVDPDPTVAAPDQTVVAPGQTVDPDQTVAAQDPTVAAADPTVVAQGQTVEPGQTVVAQDPTVAAQDQTVAAPDQPDQTVAAQDPTAVPGQTVEAQDPTVAAQDPTAAAEQTVAAPNPTAVQEQPVAAPNPTAVQEQPVVPATAPEDDPECNYKPKEPLQSQTPTEEAPQVQSTTENADSSGTEKPSRLSRFSSFLKSSTEKASTGLSNLREQIKSRSSSPTPQQMSSSPQMSGPMTTTDSLTTAVTTLIQPFANTLADMVVQKLASQNILQNTNNAISSTVDEQMLSSAETLQNGK
jgi:hypothetical protein